VGRATGRSADARADEQPRLSTSGRIGVILLLTVGNVDFLGEFLEELWGSAGISCAVALVGTASEVVACRAIGEALPARQAAATPATRFDLASLTKPVVATLALILEQSGELPLRSELGEIFPDAVPRLRGRHLSSLLRHSAGLRPWSPLFARVESRQEALELLLSGKLSSADWFHVYSDLGYILWGFAVEERLGLPLSRLLAERILVPLDIRGLGPPPGAEPDVAQCLLPNDKERDLAHAEGIELPAAPVPFHGVPHDGNARFLGGVPGHAGLFGTAEALWQLGGEWLEPGQLLRAESVARAMRGRGRYALGWWRRRTRGHGGPALSRSAYGKVGHTGGSWWIDPERGVQAVLLVHRSSPSFELAPWRRRFHAVAVALVAGHREGIARRRIGDSRAARW
jgi:serine-type D-Ala-D-Ala carboxypeptidase